MQYCPACGQPGPFTQDGLPAGLVSRGYYKCLSCGHIVIPVTYDVMQLLKESAPAAAPVDNP